MDQRKSEEIEQDLLNGKWHTGIASACYNEDRPYDTPVMNFIVEEYTVEERKEALSLLTEKYELKRPCIKQSNMMNGKWVIRVEGLLDIQKLAPHLANQVEIPAPPLKRPKPNAFILPKTQYKDISL